MNNISTPAIFVFLLLGLFAVPAAAQSNSGYPEFPPSGNQRQPAAGSERTQGTVMTGQDQGPGEDAEQIESTQQTPTRGRKRVVLPAIKVAFGIMDVICQETGRCIENDFRNPASAGIPTGSALQGQRSRPSNQNGRVNPSSTSFRATVQSLLPGILGRRPR